MDKSLSIVSWYNGPISSAPIISLGSSIKGYAAFTAFVTQISSSVLHRCKLIAVKLSNVMLYISKFYRVYTWCYS